MSGVRQVAIRVRSEGSSEVKRDFQEIGQSGNKAYDQIASGADKASAAAERQMAGWKATAAAAREAQGYAERQARFNELLNVGGGSGKSARDSAAVFEEAFASQQKRRLGISGRTAIYTASDVISSGASGMSPALIAAQQLPQVFQEVALSGGKANVAVLALGAGVATLTGFVVAGTAAWLTHVESMGRVDTSARGLGATAGLTAGQVELLVRANADLGEVSRGAAREMATAYLNTGRIGGDALGRLIALTERYAKTKGQDAEAATKELAQALADPARGLEVLQSKLHAFDDATIEHIRNLIEQNRVSDAQTAILDAMGPRLQRAADNVTVLSRAWQNLSRNVANGVDALGRGIDRMLGGGQLEERIADLIQKREKLDPWLRVNNASARQQAAALDAQIKALTAQWRDRITATDSAKTNQVLDDARAAADRANPTPGKLRELRQDRARIQAGIDSGQMTPASLKEARAALASLNKEIAAMEAGYKSSSAQASALGKAQRESAKAAREAARLAKEEARDTQQLETLRLTNALELAKIGVGPAAKAEVASLEAQLRIHQLTYSWIAAGVEKTEARARAERQVGLELLAQSNAIRDQTILDAKVGFTSTSDAMRRIGDLKLRFDDSTAAVEAFQQAEMRAFDILGNQLASGEMSWKSWKDAARGAVREVIAELIRLIAVNPLKNALFGGVNGYNPLPSIGGGLLGGLFGGGSKGFVDPSKYGGGDALGSIFKFFIPGNANGTDNWRGGLSWVGERGPELVNLPRGSQVFSNAESRRMAGGFQVGSVYVNAEAQVTKAEVQDMIFQGMRRAVREANGNVVPIVNEGLARRTVGG